MNHILLGILIYGHAIFTSTKNCDTWTWCPEQVFRGFLVSTVTFQDCRNTLSHHENFHDLSHPVTRKTSTTDSAQAAQMKWARTMKLWTLPNVHRYQLKLIYFLYGIVEHSGCICMYGGQYFAYVEVEKLHLFHLLFFIYSKLLRYSLIP